MSIRWTLPKNPFARGMRVDDPQYFAGRTLQMKRAFEAIEEGRHLFVGGERGIGKTSFGAQLRLLLRGNEQAQSRFGIAPGGALRVPVFTVCEKRDSTEMLMSKMSKALLSLFEEPETKARWLSKLRLGTPYLGVEFERPKPGEIRDCNDFVRFMKQLLANYRGSEDFGVVFFLDEFEEMAGNTGLGNWLKVLIESLHEAQLTNVQFVLIGIRDSLDDLFQQHSSLSRLIVPEILPLMSHAEIVELCSRALKHGSSAGRIEFDEQLSGPEVIAVVNDFLAKEAREWITRNGMPRSAGAARRLEQMLERRGIAAPPRLTRDQAIAIARNNIKGDVLVKFPDYVVDRIAELAAGHPHSAHMLGGEVFKKVLRDFQQSQLYDPDLATTFRSNEKELAGEITYVIVNGANLSADLLQLKEAVRVLAATWQPTEYGAAKRIRHHVEADAILAAAAAYANAAFSVDQLRRDTRLPVAKMRSVLKALVDARVLRCIDLQQYEFRDPLFRFHLRVMAEKNRYEAELQVTRLRESEGGELLRAGRTPALSAADKAEREALLLDLILSQRTSPTGQQ